MLATQETNQKVAVAVVSHAQQTVDEVHVGCVDGTQVAVLREVSASVDVVTSPAAALNVGFVYFAACSGVYVGGGTAMDATLKP